ncbi:hypothetical protein BC830DRAFT_1186302, partial [Chytriomyces sp. MP71]
SSQEALSAHGDSVEKGTKPLDTSSDVGPHPHHHLGAPEKHFGRGVGGTDAAASELSGEAGHQLSWLAPRPVRQTAFCLETELGSNGYHILTNFPLLLPPSLQRSPPGFVPILSHEFQEFPVPGGFERLVELAHNASPGRLFVAICHHQAYSENGIKAAQYEWVGNFIRRFVLKRGYYPFR